MYMFVYVCICINCIYVVLSYVGRDKESIYLLALTLVNININIIIIIIIVIIIIVIIIKLIILQTLHAKYTLQLLLEVRRILKTQGNIRYASTSLSNQITVCGDIHGKLSDLYVIFHKVSTNTMIPLIYDVQWALYYARYLYTVSWFIYY